MYSANSDRDYRDEVDGPYGRAEERVCETCHERFWMSTAEAYVMHPLCDRCLREEQALREFEASACDLRRA